MDLYKRQEISRLFSVHLVLCHTTILLNQNLLLYSCATLEEFFSKTGLIIMHTFGIKIKLLECSGIHSWEWDLLLWDEFSLEWQFHNIYCRCALYRRAEVGISCLKVASRLFSVVHTIQVKLFLIWPHILYMVSDFSTDLGVRKQELCLCWVLSSG